jgi:transposase
VSGLDHTFKPSGTLRRIEVINGAGGRRRWSADEKARIIEETLAPGAVVSEVARRHGISPQQLFGWRREARRPVMEAEPVSFVPAIVIPPSAAPAPEGRPKRRARRRAAAHGIDLEIGGVAVRVGADASPKAIAAVIRALKAGS